MLAARVYLTGHLPLSNGYETMIFAAWLSVLITLVLRAKEFLFVGGLLISGIAMLVSYISGLNPMMTSLVPVLQSPLLTIHVSLIMLAYCLLAFIALNSMIALILKFVTGNFNTQFEILSCKMLLIAVLLMGCGIFVGAIWANNSWGRYWGWDPKEVWALITFIIYGLALYGNNIQFFKRPAVFHTYLLLAFGSVLMTYLGVNIFLGGIHSY
ncbi:MAG: cytochrome c biogenesis protein CcsA [Bacteroidales bacterium]|nr:cytochrome c biogenesis protein CcsA [Bacteroidales bacterium]